MEGSKSHTCPHKNWKVAQLVERRENRNVSSVHRVAVVVFESYLSIKYWGIGSAATAPDCLSGFFKGSSPLYPAKNELFKLVVYLYIKLIIMSSNINEILKLFKEGLSYEKIGKQCGVSGNYIKKLLKKNGIELPVRRKINPKETFNKGKRKKEIVKNNDNWHERKNGLYCEVCGKELTGNQKKFCSKKCKEKKYSQEQYHTLYARKQDKSGAEMKAEYIKKMGGCCSVCGYKKNLASLVFHHVDPSRKKFTVGARDIVRRSTKSIEEELSNCIVLCQNCHNELHYPEYEGML